MKRQSKNHLTTAMKCILFCLICAAAQTAKAQSTVPKPVEIKSKLKVGINFNISNEADYKDGLLAPCSAITIELSRVIKPLKGQETYKKILSEKAAGPGAGAKDGECGATFLLPVSDKYKINVFYKDYLGFSGAIPLKIAETTQEIVFLELKKP